MHHIDIILVQGYVSLCKLRFVLIVIRIAIMIHDCFLQWFEQNVMTRDCNCYCEYDERLILILIVIIHSLFTFVGPIHVFGWFFNCIMVTHTLICISFFFQKLVEFGYCAKKCYFLPILSQLDTITFFKSKSNNQNHPQSRRVGHFLAPLHCMCSGLKHHSQIIYLYTILYSRKSHSNSFKIPLKTFWFLP